MPRNPNRPDVRDHRRLLTVGVVLVIGCARCRGQDATVTAVDAAGTDTATVPDIDAQGADRQESDARADQGGAVPADPDLRSICALSGKWDGIVNGVCPQRYGWLAPTEIVYYPPIAGESSLPSCISGADDDRVGLDTPQGWRLRIEKTLPLYQPPALPDFYSTAVLVTRLDGAKPCALKLVWTLNRQQVILKPGAIVRFSTRFTLLTVEHGYLTHMLRDENGGLLFGMVETVWPEIWDKDIWPELTISFGVEPICRTAIFDAPMLTVTLKSGADTCSVDSASARCCTFGGTSYNVVAPQVSRTKTNDSATFFVARPDVVVSAP